MLVNNYKHIIFDSTINYKVQTNEIPIQPGTSFIIPSLATKVNRPTMYKMTRDNLAGLNMY
jgi:hypothetical protein